MGNDLTLKFRATLKLFEKEVTDRHENDEMFIEFLHWYLPSVLDPTTDGDAVRQLKDIIDRIAYNIAVENGILTETTEFEEAMRCLCENEVHEDYLKEEVEKYFPHWDVDKVKRFGSYLLTKGYYPPGAFDDRLYEIQSVIQKIFGLQRKER